MGQVASSLRGRWLRENFFWLDLDVGPLAEKHGIRGEIVTDKGRREKFERTVFHGPHFVECYAIKDGYCVARDRIDVPIGTA